jgi:hypothetical protein
LGEGRTTRRRRGRAGGRPVHRDTRALHTKIILGARVRVGPGEEGYTTQRAVDRLVHRDTRVLHTKIILGPGGDRPVHRVPRVLHTKIILGARVLRAKIIPGTNFQCDGQRLASSEATISSIQQSRPPLSLGFPWTSLLGLSPSSYRSFCFFTRPRVYFFFITKHVT